MLLMLATAGPVLLAICSPRGWASRGMVVIKPVDRFPLKPLPSGSDLEAWLSSPEGVERLRTEWAKLGIDPDELTPGQVRWAFSCDQPLPSRYADKDWLEHGSGYRYQVEVWSDRENAPRRMLQPVPEIIELKLNESVDAAHRARAVADATAEWIKLVEPRESFVAEDEADSAHPLAGSANRKLLDQMNEGLKNVSQLQDPTVPLYSVDWGHGWRRPSKNFETGLTPTSVPAPLLWLLLTLVVVAGGVRLRAIWRWTDPVES